MRVSNLRRLNAPPSPRGFRSIAAFTVDVSDDFAIYDVQAIRCPDGRIAIYPSKSPNGSPTANISLAARAEIVSIISKELTFDRHFESAA
jgi:hypothetical protein